MSPELPKNFEAQIYPQWGNTFRFEGDSKTFEDIATDFWL